MSFQERALVEKLLENYHTGLRPVISNSSQPTTVNLSLRLVQIFEMVSKIDHRYSMCAQLRSEKTKLLPLGNENRSSVLIQLD